MHEESFVLVVHGVVGRGRLQTLQMRVPLNVACICLPCDPDCASRALGQMRLVFFPNPHGVPASDVRLVGMLASKWFLLTPAGSWSTIGLSWAIPGDPPTSPAVSCSSTLAESGGEQSSAQILAVFIGRIFIYIFGMGQLILRHMLLERNAKHGMQHEGETHTSTTVKRCVRAECCGGIPGSGAGGWCHFVRGNCIDR